MNKDIHFQKIDGSNCADHYHIEAADQCFYLFEYTSGVGYSYGRTNNLISNLKKKPSRHARPDYYYKRQAIHICAESLAHALNPEWLAGATLVPVPPSKDRTHPEYDDRMTQICRTIPVDVDLDVRDLVIQTEPLEAAHESDSRPSPSELKAVYQIDESQVEPSPIRIGIVDDVLTAGAHFRAMSGVLADHFPGVPVVGLFIARRVFPR